MRVSDSLIKGSSLVGLTQHSKETWVDITEEGRVSLLRVSDWMSRRKIYSEYLKCFGYIPCFHLEDYSRLPKFFFLWCLIVLESKDFYLWGILKQVAFVLFFGRYFWYCQFVFYFDIRSLEGQKYFVRQSLLFLPTGNFLGFDYQVEFCECYFSKE